MYFTVGPAFNLFLEITDFSMGPFPVNSLSSPGVSVPSRQSPITVMVSDTIVIVVDVFVIHNCYNSPGSVNCVCLNGLVSRPPSAVHDGPVDRCGVHVSLLLLSPPTARRRHRLSQHIES